MTVANLCREAVLYLDQVKREAHSVETPLKHGSRREIFRRPLSSLVPYIFVRGQGQMLLVVLDQFTPTPKFLQNTTWPAYDKYHFQTLCNHTLVCLTHSNEWQPTYVRGQVMPRSSTHVRHLP